MVAKAPAQVDYIQQLRSCFLINKEQKKERERDGFHDNVYCGGGVVNVNDDLTCN